LNKKAEPVIPDFKTWTIQELINTDFPEPKFLVPGIIAEGTTIIAGRPKIGKSWMVLQLTYCLSLGLEVFGTLPTEKSRVLYLALEDTPRRLKSRLKKQGVLPSGGGHILTQWSTDGTGILWLHKWMETYPDTKLIIIDTLQKFAMIKDSNSYSETYNAVSGIKSFGDQYGISVIIITHLTKAETDDYLINVMGSTGITGTVDNVIVLQKKRGESDAVLKGSGRDLEEFEIALKFDTSCCQWQVIGDAREVADSKARQDIIDLLKKSDDSMTPKDISAALSKNESTIKNLLSKMVIDGQIRKTDRGRYTHLRYKSMYDEVFGND